MAIYIYIERGGTVGRSERIKIKKEKTDKEILQEKLHQENLNATDIKKILYLDKDSFEAWMQRMCELYQELNAEKFKEGKYFKFKPDWHALFLVLFGAITTHPEYHRDTIKQNVTMDGISSYHKKLKDNMNEYMNEEEKLEIKASPSYIRSELQTLLVDEINLKMAKISATIQMMPEDLRFRVLAGVNEAMETWNLHLAQMTANHLVKRAMDDRGLDDRTKHEMKTYRQSFDHMLAERLRWAVECQKDWKDAESELDVMINDSQEEQDAINALFKELIADPWRMGADNEIRELLEETKKSILREPSNAVIVEKVLHALDGVDDDRVQIIRLAMEQALITLQVADEESSKARAKARRALDDMLHNYFLKNFLK